MPGASGVPGWAWRAGGCPCPPCRSLGKKDPHCWTRSVCPSIGDGPLSELMLAAARASGLPVSTTAGYPVVLRTSSSDEVPDGRFVVEVALDASPADDRTGVSELWVSSESSRAAAERIGGPVVRVVPVPVHDVGAREHVTGESVVFAAIADHELDRPGNVLGAVSAFLSAFPDRTDVELRIAVSGAFEHSESAERLRLATASDQRISLVEDARRVRVRRCRGVAAPRWRRRPDRVAPGRARRAGDSRAGVRPRRRCGAVRQDGGSRAVSPGCRTRRAGGRSLDAVVGGRPADRGRIGRCRT